MTAPQTIVCLKVVPRPEEVRVDMETLTLDRSGRSFINPADMHALEMALALKDRYGGSVRLLAMGPPPFEDYLRIALTMGADEAVLLSDRAFGGADTLATSYTLAAGIRKMGDFDLVLCGEESSDGATAQVPAGIAEWRDLPQITYATDLALIDSRWRVRATREVSGGHEVLVSSLPVVVSVRMRCNEPRFMDMSRRQWAAEAPVTIWGAEEIDADPAMIGLSGSATTVSGTHEAAGRERRREMIGGAPTEQARALMAHIRPFLVGSPEQKRVAIEVGRAPGVSHNGQGGSEPALPPVAPDPVRSPRLQRRPGEAEDGGPSGDGVDASWNGRAELLDADGSVIAEVLADLWRRPGEQWGGDVRTELGGGHLPLAGDYVLRLESDAECVVAKGGAVRAYARGGLSGEEVSVRGKGEAPF
ncbi:MAG: electron transfer flavoprotein subunit beta/FixA family protein [Dehalococcoidia bacterium]|jgi:electron transfer flavoprotein beta subunit|nr:electron transfer flavoprotein subunit beta/FixA family protein [Dehalococcoidia bacterium]